MTSNSKELIELAERCEKATGPDDRLDAEIVAALNDALLKPYPPQTDFGPGQRWQFWSLDGKHFLGNEAKYPFKVLPFTASLDAAMTLVPDGKTVRLFIAPEATAAFIDAIELAAMTPALALCAAALRARATHSPVDEGGR